MITRADADEVAADWARQESRRRGYECTPQVEEFDLGYLVWAGQPPSAPQTPGDSPTTIIDRETGRLSHWPHVPSTALQQLYRQRRGGIVDPPTTADPAVELLRSARRRITPSVAAHITVNGRLFTARGAKGDQELRHHPLVADRLRQVPRGHLVRGAERHAEMLVLSDLLHEVDRVRTWEGLPPVTRDEVRDMLRGARLETFHIRESGDRLDGQPAEPCESCVQALVDVALVPWGELAVTAEWRFDRGDDPQPGRFPTEVAWALAEGGWEVLPRSTAELLAEVHLEQAQAVEGQEHRHEPFLAALDLLCDFPTLGLGRKGPGVDQRIRLFDINVGASLHNADTLYEFGQLIGARLFPIGAENYGETALAVDERGRIFAFDQGGEWFIGDSIDEALVTLLTGRHTPRVRDDGTW